ncbi:MAG: sulfatase [Akkermansiaceae bacterium]
MSIKLSQTVILALAFCSPSLSAEDRVPSRPNILLLLSDDQDWNGLSTRMHPDIPESQSDFYETPHLAKFATQAMRFSNGYAPAPVCSPTRISLQTGMSPARLGWTKAAPAEEGHKLNEGASRKAIRADEITFPELLQRAGYKTAHFGKWHLAGGGPEHHGFDVSDGDTGNRDADAFTDPNPVDIFGMHDRAKKFMIDQLECKKPFYLQMSYHALHLPDNAMKSSLARFESKPAGKLHHDPSRAAITYDLDAGVGKLLQTIHELGLDNNTYVIYMSDNGGGGGGGKGGKGHESGLHGGKGGLGEGGIRVPFLIRGPGIKAGSWCHQPVVAYDWFPTICRWAKVKESLPTHIDGGDLSPLLEGKNQPVVRRETGLLFHFPHYQGDSPQSAIREGDFKFIFSYEQGERKLFNLMQDPGERINLADQKTDLANQLESKLRALLKETNATMPTPNPTYDPAKAPMPKRGGKGMNKEKGKTKK